MTSWTSSSPHDLRLIQPALSHRLGRITAHYSGADTPEFSAVFRIGQLECAKRFPTMIDVYSGAMQECASYLGSVDQEIVHQTLREENPLFPFDTFVTSCERLMSKCDRGVHSGASRPRLRRDRRATTPWRGTIRRREPGEIASDPFLKCWAGILPL